MKTLFITYNGALEPLIKSQGTPYLKGLAAKGIGCVLLSFEKPGKDLKAFRNEAAALKSRLKGDGIDWYWLRYHKRPSVIATAFDIFAGVMAALWLVLSKKVDIIHARASVPALMGYTAARLTGRKFIFDERGLMAEEYADGGMWRRGGILYRITRYIEAALIRKADSVVVLTDNIKRFLLESDYLSCGRNSVLPEITVIPCCVDTALFNDSAPNGKGPMETAGLSERFIFLYAGSLGTWYMLEEMMDFFIHAKTLIKKAHLVILSHIGTDIARRTAQNKGLSGGDVTIMEARFEEMPGYIKSADCGIFFIRPVLSKRSSCPIKFAEYLACGVPVMINSGIGDTDVITRGHSVGAVIERFSREDYLRGINRLLELKKEGHALSKRCVATAKELFSLDIGVSKYLSIYESLKD